MGYNMFGPQVEPDGRIRWQEWAPAASGLHLVGDFNQWEKPGLQFRKLEYGRWEGVVPPGTVFFHVLSRSDKTFLEETMKQKSKQDKR